MVKMKRHYVTVSGMTELRQRLEALKRQRIDVIGEMRELISQSSASSALEDSTLALHRDRVAELDGQIGSIENILSTAKVVDRPSSNRRVQIGSQVTVDVGGARQTYVIVGSLEADPAAGRMSNESPLGRLLLGKKVNDHIEAVFNRNSVAVKILAIA